MVSVKKNIDSFLVQKISHPRWDDLIRLMETVTSWSQYDYEYDYHGISSGDEIVSLREFDDNYILYTVEEALDILEKEDQLSTLPSSYCIRLDDCEDDEVVDILSHLSEDRVEESDYFKRNWEVIGINRSGNFDWDDVEYPYDYTLTFEQYTTLKNSTGVTSNYQIY
jgi:hypothetical protein